MALKPCRECRKDVSTQAASCPHCGVKNPIKKANGCLAIVGIIVVLVVIIGAIGANSGSNSPSAGNQNPSPQPSSDTGSASVQPSSAQSGTCSTDWRSCKDNGDLVNNSQRWPYIQSACQDKVNAEVQYGEPKWPGFLSGGAFSQYHPGATYITTGIAIAIEPDVQIENGFGAMVHSTAICQYDLNSQTVLDVSWSPN